MFIAQQVIYICLIFIINDIKFSIWDQGIE